ncbi:uncharacterized protein RCC_03472 [Ramularia collo-cygni]|uniref:F-box domain-containing protein n=1 Tax=Ramularia collo-cygni TaxID=112498 RepID=A0A2D3UUB0_9PEZI|nr:uncharacterized protein RCC_03472 [Ramularia collo-cygni]CZT17635.1 uncharacterized protein RCC_03472 [Ramularia collo-cygni]
MSPSHLTTQAAPIPRYPPTYQHPNSNKDHYQYWRYSTMELAKFATSLGLHLPHPDVRGRVIDALQKSGGEAPFPFLSLPPELRNIIYEELLIKRPDSPIRHPQILRTCKAIRDEATDILYAENYITVHVHSDRIEVSGIRCAGGYNPAGDSRALKDSRPEKVEEIIWPNFLRQAWHIALEAPENIWYYDAAQTIQVCSSRREIATNNVLYSICSFLSSGQHCLRYIDAYDCLYLGASKDEIRAALYPGKLIIKTEYNSERWDYHEGKRVEASLHDETISARAATLRKYVRPSNSLLQEVAWCFCKITTEPRSTTWKQLARSFLLGGKCVFWAKLNAMGYCKPEVIDEQLKRMVWLLRDLMGTDWIRNGRVGIKEEVGQLLLLDIELRAASVAREEGQAVAAL